MSALKNYTADHRYLLEVVGRQAGFAAPVAITLNQLEVPLLKAAGRGEILPIDGVLVRDWVPDADPGETGIQFGMRLYEIRGIRFASVQAVHHQHRHYWGLNFFAVDRRDYRRLY